MISPSEFVHRWMAEIVAKEKPTVRSSLVVAPIARLRETQLPEPAICFLAEAGLPESCAPFIGFDEVARLPLRLWDVWAPGTWAKKDQARVAGFHIIGSDGCGNPFCIEEPTGRILLLDHEDYFQSQQFVNSSVPQLAESLLAYNIDWRADCSAQLAAIDSPALVEGTYWYCEMQALADENAG